VFGDEEWTWGMEKSLDRRLAWRTSPKPSEYPRTMHGRSNRPRRRSRKSPKFAKDLELRIELAPESIVRARNAASMLGWQSGRLAAG
jgi:hypothetical protein